MGFACEELTQGTSASRKMEEMYFSLLSLSAMKTPDIIHRANMRRLKFRETRMTGRDKGM